MSAILMVIVFFTAFVLLRMAYYFLKHKEVEKYYFKYKKYCTTDSCDIVSDTPKIKTIFNEVGLKDRYATIYITHPNGEIAYTQINVFENLTNTQKQVVQNVDIAFNQAIGIYKDKIRQSYSLLFWIDVVVKLPQYILSFLGVLPESILSKLLLVIYWFALPLFGLKELGYIDPVIRKLFTP